MPSFESREHKHDPIRERWEAVAHEVDRLTDGRGKGIDPGIRELVTALRYFEFPTDGSCEGHMGGRSGPPWVHFSFIPERLKERFREAQKTAGGKWNDTQVQSLLQEANEEITGGSERLMALLDEFYADRRVSAERRLILRFFPDSVRLESQGAYIQERYSADQKEKHWTEFREEMAAFTEFMRWKIYADPERS